MRLLFYFTIFSFVTCSICAQDTFSIVAVDSVTGEVGSAGATCLDNDDIEGGAVIISRLIPGVGAINTQSYWDPQNQNNATQQLEDGKNAQEIITWLEQNDVANNPAIRQYGVAVLDTEGMPSAAGFTGDDCFDVKIHKSGDYYSVQGNILLNEDVVNNMEQNFLETTGTLAERLMAAMQGANIPGADSRCLQEGTSSQSAFLRVARPGDSPGNFYLDLIVSKTDFGQEPIDSLQKSFDNWTVINSSVDEDLDIEFLLYPNPIVSEFKIIFRNYNAAKNTELIIRDPQGRITQIIPIKSALTEATLKKSKFPTGQYIYTLNENGAPLIQNSFIVSSK